MPLAQCRAETAGALAALVKPNFDDPTIPPGEGWDWKGPGAVGSTEGNWYNESLDISLHPDLEHPAGIEPHYDMNLPGWSGKFRYFRDGTLEYEPTGQLYRFSNGTLEEIGTGGESGETLSVPSDEQGSQGGLPDGGGWLRDK